MTAHTSDASAPGAVACASPSSPASTGSRTRAKAAPNGILSHLVGNVVVYVGTALGPLLVLLAASAVLVDGVSPTTAGGWMRLVWVSVLGLTATIPTGAVLGAVVRNPIVLGWMSLLIYGSMAVSGVFYPLRAFPGWLQIVGRLLPTYWMGLGLRSALLPAEAIELELGQSWQTFQTVAALGTWTVAGLVLAPIALRRMARHQSGSRVAATRERVMAKGY